MSLTFECNWEEFKHRVKEFADAAPTLNQAELDNAYKAVGLSYLAMNEPMWQSSAAIVLNMASRTFMQREMELS
jgi:hypothetical protein